MPTVMECWNWAHGGNEYVNDARRDSCGCLIFYDSIAADYERVPEAKRYLWGNHVGYCLGIVVAHELGHALGIPGHSENAPNPDVMSTGSFAHPDENLTNLEKYSRFVLSRIDSTDEACAAWSYYRYAVNCRDVLGIQTVMVGW